MLQREKKKNIIMMSFKLALLTSTAGRTLSISDGELRIVSAVHYFVRTELYCGHIPKNQYPILGVKIRTSFWLKFATWNQKLIAMLSFKFPQITSIAGPTPYTATNKFRENGFLLMMGAAG